MKRISIVVFSCLMMGGIACAQTIVIDAKDTGRTFEGIGMLSAGASSRLLYDYPEPYRSDILDYLFKPQFGANLWQLKVENGGDVNSTDGSELAYAHTKEEFLHPRSAYFNRGYEWWLIKEAKKRNPDIQIEILQWGAPGWIDSFYSKENAEFIAAYINGLKRYHDITVDYTGIHNEVMYDISWIKLLRKTLDEEGLSHVKIDVGDQWKPEVKWKIANDIAKDPVLDEAVYAINAHVPEETDFYLPPNAFKIKKPVWSGESHASGGDWHAAAKMARTNNHSYPIAKITKVIYWSLITSYPDYLTAPGSGIMKANTPWSGNYTVQPPLWITAHINQFAKPGWEYINGGCKYFQHDGWSVITLKDTVTNDYSIIIETMDAKDAHTVHFKLNGFADKPLAVWESSFGKSLFQRQTDINPEGSENLSRSNEFTITLQPQTIYSLTTTHGQSKGSPEHIIPSEASFPGIYKDNFDQDSLNREPPFFINYHGAFEIVKDKDSDNQYLKQFSRKQGINWFSQPYPRIILGDSSWANTRLSVDFFLPDTGVIRIESRLHDFSWNSKVEGYAFELNDKGGWKLKLTNTGNILKQGNYKFVPGKWYHCQFNCIGDQLTVWLDGSVVVTVRDKTFKSGVVALSSGWNEACFDNFSIEGNQEHEN